ncbi:MAG: putative replicative DNA helicase [uncultured marine phage]|uniref:Putative replicative DNA helicase n=1 Tax=uncultured marine phage TaxID=707152 RepID=A0A8D9FS80_9VIRU|nr:MAG: putative replicative DNA helicase [uncultured marine phage]
MITLKENKLNLIVGHVDSAKTTLIINTVVDYIQEDEEKEVLFFSPDTKYHHIDKKIHCLVNDVDLSSVKHDKKTLKPTGLTLPKGLLVFDDCKEYDSIKQNIREFTKGGKPSLIILDNINQIDFGFKGLPYKEKISKIFDTLCELADKEGVTILASFYMLKIANWEDDMDFSSNDENLGSMVLVQREDRVVDVFDEEVSTSFKYTINPRNLKLEQKATVHLN